METGVAAFKEKKQRHWLLTTWLVIYFLLEIELDIFGKSYVFLATLPQHPASARLVYFLTAIIFALLTIICLIALFLWEKWGFYGYAAITIVSNVITLTTCLAQHAVLTGVLHLIVGFGEVAILYGILHVQALMDLMTIEPKLRAEKFEMEDNRIQGEPDEQLNSKCQGIMELWRVMCR